MKRLGLVILVATFFVGCNGSKNQTNIELIQDMMDQINVKAQDWDPDRPGMLANHYPPDNTVPIGYKPVPYKTDPVAANEKIINPFAADTSPELLALGKAKYEIYCIVCHGEHLTGDGTVAPKMLVKPPSLLSDKIRGYKDGRIFHIISYGQGVMGSYATQLHDPKQRWAIIKYIRSVQHGSQKN
jgi:mono/diheme cytochrome c family protein